MSRCGGRGCSTAAREDPWFTWLGNLPTDADKTKANLYSNGEVIRFDATGSKQDGWNWADAEKTTAELYGASCTACKTNRSTSVVVEFGCMQIPVVLL